MAETDIIYHGDCLDIMPTLPDGSIVYLDEPIFPYRKQLWCHMWCSNVEYLHQFADSLGLKRSWFQNRPDFPHYDLSPSLRQKAMQRGATAVTCRELLKIVRSGK